MDDSKQKATANSSSSGKKTVLNILALLQSARQTYGLRTNDYARYHGHCVKKIQSLHRATSTVSKPPKSASAATAKKAKSKKANASTAAAPGGFKSRTKTLSVDDVIKDERILELFLWEAERAWAEGMRTREELAALERSQSQSKTKGTSLAGKRHRSVRRLVTATSHAGRLLKLLNELDERSAGKVAASTRLQAHIYSLYLSGTHSFVLASSPSATSASTPAKAGSEALSTAYVLLEEFAKTSTKATEEALAFEMLDELEPMIRFCAYKSDLSKSGEPIPETARRIGQPLLAQKDPLQKALQAYAGEEEAAKKAGLAKKDRVEAVREIAWRDLTVPVRSAELSTALGQVHSALAYLDGIATSSSSTSRKNKSAAKSASVAASGVPSARLMAAYDRALATLSDAEDRARKLVDDNTTALARAHSARFEASSKPLGIAHNWIMFQLLSLRIKRDEALIASTHAKLSKREEKRTARLALTAENKLKQRKNSRKSGASAATSGARVSSQQIPLPIKRKRVKAYPAIIKLLDGILQSLEQIRELSIVEEDSEDLVGMVDAKIANDKARRCLYLAQTYALLDKYPESLTLYQRGSLYVREARSLSDSFAHISADALDSEGTAQLGVSPLLTPAASIDESDKALTSAQQRAEKDWFLYHFRAQQKQQQAATEGEKDSLSGAVQGMAIDPTSDAAPAAASKARKGPLFFDVAFNYIAGVDLDRLDAASKGEEVTLLTTQTVGATAEKEVEGLVGTIKEAVTTVKDAVMEQPVDQSMEVELAQKDDGAKAAEGKSGGGIWGFFGRKK